jgi:hypothetical protein
VPNSWISRWTLLDLFLVLIAALAVSRLWNNYWGLFALITLALIWHEAGAPRFIVVGYLRYHSKTEGFLSIAIVVSRGLFVSWHSGLCV